MSSLTWSQLVMFVFCCISAVNMNFCAAGFFNVLSLQTSVRFFSLSGHVTEHRVIEYFGGWSVMDLVAKRCFAAVCTLPLIQAHVCFPLNLLMTATY